MLELTDLYREYEAFEFGPVDLTVGEEVLAVLGPSGSGKTTLLSLVSGIAAPDAGSVALSGRSLVGRPPEERGTGLVFQDGALFPHMTARENVGYAAADGDRVADLVERLEISDVLDRRPGELSGGERRRVALARTLAADPDALLLDEPLSSLDAPIRRRLRGELHELFASLSVPVVYVTHDRRAATALGDRIAVLHDGRVEQVGPPSEVLGQPRTRFVASFTGSDNLFEAEVARRTGDGVVLRVGDASLRSTTDAPVGAVRTGCVRPSRVGLLPPEDRVPPGDRYPPGSRAPAAGENVLSGTVRRWIHEGDEYRVTVDVDGADLSIAATVPPPIADGIDIDSGSAVRASIPPEDVHLIDPADGG